MIPIFNVHIFLSKFIQSFSDAPRSVYGHDGTTAARQDILSDGTGTITIYGLIGRGPRKSDLLKDLSILGGALVGFFLVLAIGAFTAYYPSELGRQMLPMTIMVLLFSMRTSEYAVVYLILNNKAARQPGSKIGRN